jgi:hypothetical protein
MIKSTAESMSIFKNVVTVDIMQESTEIWKIIIPFKNSKYIFNNNKYKV